MAAAVAHQEQWCFEKDIIAFEQQHSHSRMSSPELLGAEDNVRITPSMDEIKTALRQGNMQNAFDERYLSSEEALSPTDPDMDFSDADDYEYGYDFDDDVDDYLEDRSPTDNRSSKGSMVVQAIAITIITAGKAKVVDVPPSPTTAASRRSSALSRQRHGQPTLEASRLSNISLAQSSSSTNSAPSSRLSDLSGRSSPSSEYAPTRDSASCETFQFGSVAGRRNQSITRTSDELSQPLFRAIKASAAETGSVSADNKSHQTRFRGLSQKFSQLARKPIKVEDASPLPSPKAKRRGSFTMEVASSQLSRSKQPRKLQRVPTRGRPERCPAVQVPSVPAGSTAEIVATELTVGSNKSTWQGPRSPWPRNKNSPAQRRKSVLMWT